MGQSLTVSSNGALLFADVTDGNTLDKAYGSINGYSIAILSNLSCYEYAAVEVQAIPLMDHLDHTVFDHRLV